MNRLRRHRTYCCSFCDKSQEQVQRLIAGKGVFICDECIGLYTRENTVEQPGKGEAVRCSFCGKKGYQVQRLVSGPRGVYICNECLDLCCEILDEEQSSGPRNA